jgi:transposase
VVRDHKRWQYRARARLRATGFRPRLGRLNITSELERMLEDPEGIDTQLYRSLECSRQLMEALAEQQHDYERRIEALVKDNDVVARLRTIPGFGKLVSVYFYATIGDVQRFRSSHALSAYLGLAPSIRQTGDVVQLGHITKQGSPSLRRVLVQAAHVVTRSTSKEAEPLRRIYDRIYSHKKRKKIAVVALARHLALIARRVWLDGIEYDPRLVRCATSK